MTAMSKNREERWAKYHWDYSNWSSENLLSAHENLTYHIAWLMNDPDNIFDVSDDVKEGFIEKLRRLELEITERFPWTRKW